MTARVITTTSADHGILHEASPPVLLTAGIMVHDRQVGLFQLERQLSSGWGRQKKLIILTVYRSSNYSISERSVLFNMTTDSLWVRPHPVM